MKIDGILPFARILLEKAATMGDIVIDATVGNGYDTLHLANLVGPNGRVYGYDIQEQAIFNSKQRLKENAADQQVTLFQESHHQILSTIPVEHHGKVKAAIFNLGYLPGADKEVVTKPSSTLAAIEQILAISDHGSIIVLVIYYGHPGGKVERDAVLSYVKNIEQKTAHVLKYSFINQKNEPSFIVAIEKR